jgi:hypothetical protein
MVFVVLGVVLAVSAVASASPIVWTGPAITFTKAPSADWTQAANQDRITDSTWLTRKDSKGIFNIVSEAGFSDAASSLSPANTEWAYGAAVNYASLTFTTLINLGGAYGIGNDLAALPALALHLISDDIYIDVKILSWEQNYNLGGRGGFSYERSTAGGEVIPEPATMTLLGLGLGGIAMLRRRKA